MVEELRELELTLKQLMERKVNQSLLSESLGESLGLRRRYRRAWLPCRPRRTPRWCRSRRWIRRSVLSVSGARVSVRVAGLIGEKSMEFEEVG